jgi:3'(2'), 5'-bisphosphate nucleotidase
MCDIAEEAGAAIMSIYRAEIAVEFKLDESPITIADLKADGIIRERLMALYPDIPIISEESQSVFDGSNDPHTYFLVDPLDGTKEFIKRNGEFTVNIALIYHGRPIAGVVYAPALELMYYAGKELGAWRRTSSMESMRIMVRDEQPLLRVVASRSHSSPAQDAWLAALTTAYSFVAAGSSLKFCKIAEGEADVYPRLVPTSQWDTAAGQCILEIAGGRVVDIHGNPLKYGCNFSILNPSFFAVGTDAASYIANLPRCPQ